MDKIHKPHHLETMVEIIRWYFQGNHPSRVSERWCEMDFVHAQELLGPYEGLKDTKHLK